MADDLDLLDLPLPAPYRAAFSTRQGGVSVAPYDSLNVGLTVGDEPKRVVANRRRLADAFAVDPERAELAFLEHGPRVRRAERRGILDPALAVAPCDGLWTDEAGQALLVAVADCLPVVLWRADDRVPALAVLHAGWRGLVAGVVEEGVAALGGGRLQALIGPGIGPCCYEVGEDVATPFRAHFGTDVVSGRQLDLRLAAHRALERSGVEEIADADACVSCDRRFFSHRRDQGQTGRQALIAVIDD